jgi:hypothetical protein
VAQHGTIKLVLELICPIVHVKISFLNHIDNKKTFQGFYLPSNSPAFSFSATWMLLICSDFDFLTHALTELQTDELLIENNKTKNQTISLTFSLS